MSQNDNLTILIFQECLELMQNEQMFTNENTEIGDGRRSFGIYFSDGEMEIIHEYLNLYN